LAWEASFYVAAATEVPGAAEDAAEGLLLVVRAGAGIHEQFRFLCAKNGCLK
jgi:hypothetical protein